MKKKTEKAKRNIKEPSPWVPSSYMVDTKLHDVQTITDFELEPLNSPDAGKLVISVEYDMFNRTVTLGLLEDDKLNGLRFLMAIKDIFDRAKTHPDLKGKDQIVFRPKTGKVPYPPAIRFGGLLVQGHSCKLQKGMLNGAEMYHEVVIGFERMEIDN